MEPPATREQIEALVLVFGCYISKYALSDQWHIRMRDKDGVHVEVCTVSKDQPISWWHNFPQWVKRAEQYSLEVTRFRACRKQSSSVVNHGE